jgi:uncharacterized protein
MTAFEEKQAMLERTLGTFPSLLVAFSGGVDSTVLTVLAHKVLGEALLAVTARSALHTPAEMALAGEIAASAGFRHQVVDSDEMALPAFQRNGPNRCYHCKKALLTQMRHMADRLGIAHIAHGANRDDDNDHRPGEAAAREMAVRAPLREVGLSKVEIRRIARDLGLPNWDLPANACLATRIPSGTRLSPELIAVVGQAESVVRELGIDGVRVRHHGEIARIEIDPSDWAGLLPADRRRVVVAELKRLGFKYVVLDLAGYQRGSTSRRTPIP